MDGFDKIVTFEDFAKVEQSERRKITTGILNYGVPFLDDAGKGILKNDLILLGSISGGGKTELATHVAYHNALLGKKVIIFSLESEPLENQRRILYKAIVRKYFADPNRRRCHLNYYDWYCDELEDSLGKYRDEALAELREIKNLEIYYKGQDEFTIETLEKALASKKGYDLIVIDHFHYFDHEEGNPNDIYKRLIKRVRDLVFQHSTPILLIAHLRKSDRRNLRPLPDMEDFHGSSDLFKVPTKIITMAGAGEYHASPDFVAKYPNKVGSHSLWATYMTISKLRQDGSRTRFKSITVFDASENSYLDHYSLGDFDEKGKWVPLDKFKYPHWARIK